MSDSFTALLGARKQETGANENTWGDLLNQDTIDVFDAAIAGTATHAVTGGTLDLTADPLVEQSHIFSGILSSDLTVEIPNLSKRMLVFNNTSGAFFMLLKTASGDPICIPQGTIKDVWCDGSDGVRRMDQDDVGEVKFFGCTSVPNGFFAADGSNKSRTLTIDLFGKIGTTWGVGNGATTYGLPLLTDSGRYLRSSASGLTVGTYQADAFKAHNHTASATTTVNTTLSIASDGAHTHTVNITDPGHTHSYTYEHLQGPSGLINVGGGITNPTTNGTTGSATTGITAATVSAGAHSHSGSTASSPASTSVTVDNAGDTETRPVSAVMLACIRY